MRYPEKLKIGDTIGICAPSGGIDNEEKIKRLEEAEKQLQELGYKIIETASVRTQEKGRSARGKQRAEEFMSLLENDEVKLIIFATGGDYLCEMLDYLDFEKIKSLPLKWLQGYSDITGIEYVFNELLDIPSIYGQTVKDYAMKPLHESLVNALKISSGDIIIQNSFETCEERWDFSEKTEMKNEEINYNKGYDLKEKVEWKNITGQEEIVMEGRAIGGCLDCILSFIGTKYDNVKEYLEKYKEDGFVWYFDCFELGSAALFRALWQMKNAGYFKYCNGIIFGRPLIARDDYGISFNESILEAMEGLNIPIIADADIGHVSPQLNIVNGSVIKITSKNGKGKVETKFI